MSRGDGGGGGGVTFPPSRPDSSGLGYGGGIPVPIASPFGVGFDAAGLPVLPAAGRGLVPNAVALYGGPALDLGQTYSANVSVASQANNAAISFDFSTVFRTLVQQRARRDARWRLAYLYGFPDGTGSGPWVFDQFLARDFDLGQNVACRGGFMPLNSYLPPAWEGGLTVNGTNRTGAGSAFHLTLWLAPAPGSPP